jgi:hypothetical protein
MIIQDIKALKTRPVELRKFGLTVGGVFLLLGIWCRMRGKLHYLPLLVPGAVLVLLGAVIPRTLKFIYIAWMSLAFVLGSLVSTVLLTVFYYGVLTPIGWIARLAGKDFLRRQFDPQARTYWLRRDGTTERGMRDYEQQF